MIGVLMLVALAACGIAVALWDRDSVVLDFPESERRSCFTTELKGVWIEGVDISGFVVSVQSIGPAFVVSQATAAGFARACERLGYTAREALEVVGAALILLDDEPD